MKTVLLIVGPSASSVLTAQVNPPDSDATLSTPAPQPVPPYQRPVSLGRIIPNIVTTKRRSGSLGYRVERVTLPASIRLLVNSLFNSVLVCSLRIPLHLAGCGKYERANDVAP